MSQNLRRPMAGAALRYAAAIRSAAALVSAAALTAAALVSVAAHGQALEPSTRAFVGGLPKGPPVQALAPSAAREILSGVR
jgi:hypothetical protein